MASSTAEKDWMEPGNRLAEDVAALVLRRLHDEYPCMFVDSIKAIGDNCRDMIVRGVTGQRAATMERRDRTTFFTLPPELRNYIYELVVVQSDPGPLRIQGSNRRLEQPAVSMACREMRNATLPTFYGENVIRFSDRGITVDAVYRDIVQGRQTSEIVNTLMEAECDDILGSALAWLRKIGPRNVALVKQLHLELSPFNKKFVFRKGPTSVACLMPERVRLQQVLVQYSGTAGIPLPPRMLVEKDEWEIRGEYTRETMVLEFPVTDDSALVHEAQGVAEESEPTRALPEDEAEEAVVFS